MHEIIDSIKQHLRSKANYSQRDFEHHFSAKENRDVLSEFLRKYSHEPLKFFQSSEDFGALVTPALQVPIAEYGEVQTVGQEIAQNVSESRETVRKRFLWKTEPVEDYLEGEAFKQTYIEGAAAPIRWRKPGAKIAESQETVMDLPLDVMQANVRLTLQEFAVRDNKNFAHELHNATSNEFDNQAVDKSGTLLSQGWRALFDNVFEELNPSNEFLDWADIRGARAKMLRRERDAARPTVCICNASTEAHLADDNRVQHANLLGGSDTFFRTGSLPNIYGLRFLVVADAHWGFFTNDLTRRNGEFTTTNDVFLIQPEGAIFRHTREPISTESWRIYDGQKQALNIWERYVYSVFRYTNVMRIKKSTLV